MLRPALILALSMFAVLGCQSLPGAGGLAIKLQARGLSAVVGQEFDGSLLSGDGTTICVGAESVSVYEFPDAGAAQKAAATIDRKDPSMVGNAIVEWVGPPRFWIRGRLIVLYVGGDDAVDGSLRQILGPPLAEGVGWGRGAPHKPACR